ncbi:MAG TPA: DUF4239 domain-containing protein [Casimicrobiaceae bacterium]|nr:DUF4239 domain-containing protein [Casimicrobiaceae bacterium]
MLQIVNPVVVGGGVAVTMFFGIMIALISGRRVGQRAIARDGATLANVSSLEAAVFALLGLLIAFTFSGALSRFDARRAQAVDEANAIGTAYLRIDLLPSSAQQPLRDTLKSYVDARIATYRALPDIAASRAHLQRSQEIQSELWSRAVTAVHLPETRPGTNVLLIPALNQMFDISSTRIAATQIHPPLVIYAMLVGLALASGLLAGYQTAGERGYDWLHKIGFAGVVAFTVYVILDLEYPRLGFIRLDAIDALLVDVRAGMR